MLSDITKQLGRNLATYSSELKNGLKVIGNFQQGETCCIGVFIKVGSRQEGLDNNGIAHFLEHMYFKGSDSFGYNEIEERCEEVGGLLNAHTSREYQCFSFHCLKEHVKIGLELISDMVLNPSLNKRAIERERDVILREQQQVTSVVEELFYEVLHRVSFPDHPLGYPIIGSIKNINKKINLKKMKKFRNEFYDYSKMALVGCGSIEQAELIHLGETYLTKEVFPSKTDRILEPSRSFNAGAYEILDVAGVSQLSSSVVFEGPGYDRFDEMLLLNLIQIIIGFYEIFEKKQFSTQTIDTLLSQDESIRRIFPFCFPYTDCSLFGVSLINGGDAGTLELVNDLHKNLKKYEFKESELEVAKDYLLLQTIYFMENSLHEIVEDMGRTYLLSDGNIENYSMDMLLKFIEKTTVEDIQNFWDKYLIQANPVSVFLGDTTQL